MARKSPCKQTFSLILKNSVNIKKQRKNETHRRKLMLTSQDVMPLIQSLVWLLAGVGVFIVGMNFLSDALEKSAGSEMKRLLGKISNNRFSGVGVGVGVTAIIQSSSATSVTPSIRSRLPFSFLSHTSFGTKGL